MQTVAHQTDNFFIHTPSRVDFGTNKDGHYIGLDDKWRIQLDRRSPIVGQLQLGVNEKHLKQQVLDGKFFIVDDRVIDYRFKDELKNCHVHNDDAIKALVDHLGFSKAAPRSSIQELFDASVVEGVGKVLARSQTERFECNATESLGGQFDIKIGFSWSPFSVDIHSYIEMWRQVCENGAIAHSPLMNHRIPMLNGWETNLEISNEVIRHNFDKVVFPRLKALPTERISLNDVQVLMRIVDDQRASKQLEGDSQSHLDLIAEKLDGVWDTEAGSLKKSLLKFIPAPVTAFDAMNIATEIATHHVARDRTNARAQAFVNSLIFDQNRGRNLNVDLNSLIIGSETFNQVDQAFFGVTCH